MTGFAAVSREDDGQRVNVTVKSVNHRFLDVLVKAPASLAALEGRVRAVAQQRLARGRIEVALSAELTEAPAREVTLDHALIEQVADALASARTRGLVAGDLTVSDLLRIPHVLDIRVRAEDAASGVSDEVTDLVEHVVGEALDALVVMRETEGRFLRADLDTRLEVIAAFVDEVEQQARQGQQLFEARLRERIADLPADVAGEPAMLAQEIVRFVARSDVDEELVRLRGHMDHWRSLADGPEPCGRKLDFLLQEMNREINTIGSKAEGLRVTEIVIAAKAELERVREQVQNVE